MKNMFSMMKEAASMKKNLKKIQDGLKRQRVEYDAGNGNVKAVARGDASIVSITIDPDFFKNASVKDMEKMVLKAVDGALEEAKKLSAEEMSKMAGEMGLPKIPGLGL
jgi:DNA-binding YbaB/EbfC family protein